jgi:DNA modification methylase
MKNMAKIIHGPAVEVLSQQIQKESIDTIYTTPSPFAYYREGNEHMLGGEQHLDDYINNLMKILRECYLVLKPSGSMFLQIPEHFNKLGGMFGMPIIVENNIRNSGTFFIANRLFWHRTELTGKKLNYKEKGFLKNYEYIFHLVKDHYAFYFNENSKYARTSVFSYPLEDSYYTNEFDSGLPYQLSEMVIDTTVPKGGIVLDPLAGSCKLGVVAKKMNVDFIGIDIDLQTVEAARIRLGL